MFQEGGNAASFAIAEQYMHAFSKLAKHNNTVILPANAGDVTSMVAQVSNPSSSVQNTNCLSQGNSQL